MQYFSQLLHENQFYRSETETSFKVKQIKLFFRTASAEVLKQADHSIIAFNYKKQS